MRTDILVNHVMFPDPTTVDSSASLGEVRQAFADQQFNHLPVVDGDRLVGLISSNDLLRVGLGDGTASSFLDSEFRAADVMKADLVTISNRASVAEAARMLSAGGFHALPVVDAAGGLHGIVTSTDLLNYMLDEPVPAAPPDLVERLKLLEHVLQAAEHYLHSGLGATEHMRLEKAIDDVRK